MKFYNCLILFIAIIIFNISFSLNNISMEILFNFKDLDLCETRFISDKEKAFVVVLITTLTVIKNAIKTLQSDSKKNSDADKTEAIFGALISIANLIAIRKEDALKYR